MFSDGYAEKWSDLEIIKHNIFIMKMFLTSGNSNKTKKKKQNKEKKTDAKKKDGAKQRVQHTCK